MLKRLFVANEIVDEAEIDAGLVDVNTTRKTVELFDSGPMIEGEWRLTLDGVNYAYLAEISDDTTSIAARLAALIDASSIFEASSHCGAISQREKGDGTMQCRRPSHHPDRIVESHALVPLSELDQFGERITGVPVVSTFTVRPAPRACTLS